MPLRIGTGIALLADPTRRQIMAMVAERPRRPSALARALGVSRSTATRQLRLLEDAGLLVRRRSALDGRGVLYFMEPKRVGQIIAWLAGTQIGFENPSRRPAEGTRAEGTPAEAAAGGIAAGPFPDSSNETEPLPWS